MIVTILRNNSYKSAYVPTDHDVQIKEHIRMTNDFKEKAIGVSLLLKQQELVMFCMGNRNKSYIK